MTIDAVLAASAGVTLTRVLATLLIAAVSTVISLRLLGMRRGWATALLSGLIGWGVAAILALNLAKWDWGAEDLVVHMVVIGVPATMSAAVAFDLLARPGSLAIGERAGLVVAPRPIRAMRRRVSVAHRYRELLKLARREGFGPYISAGSRPESAADPTGVRLRRLLEDAGGVYVKLGQIAATRVDLLPPEVCEELATLQNRASAVPTEEVKPALEAELGGTVEQCFADFDWQPLAAASISQAYSARLHTGEPVVVKIQRPGIDEIMERDLAALALLADLAQRRTPFGQNIRSGELLSQFADGLRAELDFHREADAMIEMTMLLGGHTPVRIPKVYAELSTRKLLVQERFEGCTAADTAQLDAAGIDRKALAEELLRSSLDQMLKIGFFHADPHPGNVFAFPDGTLGLIDFGAVGRLDSIEQSAVTDMLGGLMTRDVGLLRNGIERTCDVSEIASPEQLERALARLMADHMRVTGMIEATVLQDLVSTLSQFGIRLPTDLVVLSRALVTLDGTLRVIAPGFSLVAAAAEMTQATPKSDAVLDPEEMVKTELMGALPSLLRLPDKVDRVLTLTSRGELRLRTIVDEDSRRVVRTLGNRALLVAVGAALLFSSTALLVAPDSGPLVTSGTGLFEVLGYGGLLAGIVLELRVVAAVARDGTT